MSSDECIEKRKKLCPAVNVGGACFNCGLACVFKECYRKHKKTLKNKWQINFINEIFKLIFKFNIIP
jgi:hypothetical protein